MFPIQLSKPLLHGSLIALLVGLVGCSVTEVSPTTRLQPPEGEGTVVMSLTRAGDVNASVWLGLRKEGGGAPKQVLLDSWSVKRDWAELKTTTRINELNYSDADAPVGRLAVLQLPAGNYEIYQWQGDNTAWPRGGIVYQMSSLPFSLKFTVRQGEVTYLGQVQLVLPDQIPRGVQVGDFRMTITPHADRDLALFKTKYSDASNVAVAMAPAPVPNEVTGRYYYRPLDSGSSDRN